jgi:hypothetical protein
LGALTGEQEHESTGVPFPGDTLYDIAGNFAGRQRAQPIQQLVATSTRHNSTMLKQWTTNER